MQKLRQPFFFLHTECQQSRQKTCYTSLGNQEQNKSLCVC